MSEPILQTLLRGGFNTLLAVGGWELSYEGTNFRAMLVEADPLTVQAALGEDVREACILEGLREDVPTFKRGGLITKGDYTWKVLKRTDNDAGPKVTYIVQKVVAGVDA